MGIDPKAQSALHLVKELTRGPLAGPITPRWLSAGLPKVGEHRGWIDHVVIGVLSHILSAYRVIGKRTKPYWSGPAYQINRRELALLLDCRLRDISTAVVFLERIGLIWVFRKTRYNNGEPCGTVVNVIPNVEAIADMLREVEAAGRGVLQNQDQVVTDGSSEGVLSHKAKVPESGTQGGGVEHSAPTKSGTQTHEDAHKSLNVLKTANSAEGHTAQPVTPHSAPSPSHRLGRADGGGGGAAADASSTSCSQADRDEVVDLNEQPKPGPPGAAGPLPVAASSRNGHRANGPTSAAQDHARVERQVSNFCYYWDEAGRRSGYLELVQINEGDRKALRTFFENESVCPGWFAAVAIRAWAAGEDIKKKGNFDPVWGCCRSKDIQSFIRLRSRILSELGANRFKVNAYKNLRRYFTDSELRNQGFDVEVGLEVLNPARCWENDEDAPGYYVDRSTEMPPEVRAVLADASSHDNKRNGE